MWRAGIAAILFFGTFCKGGHAWAAVNEPGGLDAFSSETELQRYLDRVTKLQAAKPLPPAVPAPPLPGAADKTTPSAPAAASVTNNQIAGVDEGDIVKAKDDWLIVLRRGRLFTFSLKDGGLKPTAMIEAYPPGVDARGDWYDEMLIEGDQVIVIGYSYRRGGTQISRFKLAENGRLSFEDAYQLRSDDYYSSRNYASRLVGSTLYLYAPIPISGKDLRGSLPAMRKWTPDVEGKDGFGPTISAQNIYLPRPYRDGRNVVVDRLHTVTMCDLAAPEMRCRSTGVLGGWSRSFFVSRNAVYVWVGDAWRTEDAKGANAFLYRIPLDGSRPSAVAARGQPIDQFSFSPDPGRSALHVLVRASGSGDAMWSPEVTGGGLAMVTIPTAAFGDGSGEVPLDRYTNLPQPTGHNWNIHNRFVGDHLLYAGGSTGTAGNVTVVSLADRIPLRLRLPHGVDRLDAIGDDAIAIGTGDRALGFTPISLAPEAVHAGATFLLADGRENESRSHAFYFRADPGSSDGSGMLGLPVTQRLPSLGDTAGVLFLSRQAGRLAEAGRLDATPARHPDDRCVASCVDWYGNARPIFYRDRIFALLGYELVEGARVREQVVAKSRSFFGPEKHLPER